MKYILATLLLVTAAACTRSTQTATSPAGDPTSAKTDVLKTGAKALQDNSPLGPMDVYLVGFHPMKDHPSHQMEAHHYCHQVNEDFAQCTLFDGNTASANLTGIEYIISEKLFERLTPAERQYWHPHNGEILSGQLIAPGLPEVAEKELMRSKINSYGKTWHVWMTSDGDKLPIGPAALAWSFNRDGEPKPGLVEDRDRRLKVDTAAIRKSRQDLVRLASPQSGVDQLKDRFGRPTSDIPGVTSRKP
ncbi:hypothetical protein F183_A19720 [Bryobacterales bacterium F-183]|nr:hypothetical protein F183_A19720 [Bryobacterales bacterium F-183]